MKVRNLAVATLVAVGAGALAVRGLLKNQELAEKAKEDGKKVFNDAKEFGATVKTAATSTVEEIKEKASEVYTQAKEELKMAEDMDDDEYEDDDYEEDDYEEEDGEELEVDLGVELDDEAEKENSEV